MVTNDSNGWWWHFSVYNYITKESKSFNSPKPFETYAEALDDLIKFIWSQTTYGAH